MATSDGRKLCGCGCGKPRDRKGQSYRRECHARYMREWRAGRVEVLLTWQEYEDLMAARAGAGGAGRHRASR